MSALLFSMPGNERLSRSLVSLVGCQLGVLESRTFPDGETYLRYLSSIHGRSVIIVAPLDRPNEKILPLLFAVDAARDLGASRIVLVAPYLPYLRQDKRFREGEAVTSRLFARLISHGVDALITVDPHLHRLKNLSDIYCVPVEPVSASRCIAEWISEHVSAPLLVGPDEESEQWVSEIAAKTNSPFVVLQKVRRGDRDVVVSLPDMTLWKGRTPVLVDDIISTGATMISALGQLRAAGFADAACIAVHGIFAGTSYHDLVAAGAARIATTNTVPNPDGRLDISPVLAAALTKFLN